MQHRCSRTKCWIEAPSVGFERDAVLAGGSVNIGVRRPNDLIGRLRPDGSCKFFKTTVQDRTMVSE